MTEMNKADNEDSSRRLYFIRGERSLSAWPARWGGNKYYGVDEGQGRFNKKYREWWGEESYKSFDEAKKKLAYYRVFDLDGNIRRAKSESQRIEWEAKMANFNRHHPDIIEEQHRVNYIYNRRIYRMFRAPWYSQPIWWLVYGRPAAWLTFVAIAAIGFVILFLTL